MYSRKYTLEEQIREKRKENKQKGESEMEKPEKS